ncbi:MAG: ATP-binding protein [Nitrososphaerota archaeon]|nr:ATP-binding protein [Nitrososphaerota archaeon]
MANMAAQIFDDMGGKFQARLKGMRTETKSASSGQFEGTMNVALLEAKFDMDVFDRLHDPTFVAIERSSNSGTTYLVYEVVSVHPMHYQMLGVTASIPQQIREEFLERVSESWGHSQETWIDLGAYQTGYRLSLVAGKPEFERSSLTPLQGSVAHILSRESVEEFLCVRDGLEVGKVKGLDIRLKVDDPSLVMYHVGVFAFTGSGKSNLTSYIVRSLMERDRRLKVCVLDVSGEYAVQLIDRLDDGMVLTTEEFDDVEKFAQSQVMPETLGLSTKQEKRVHAIFQKLRDDGRLKYLMLDEQTLQWDLEKLYRILQAMLEGGKVGSLPVEGTLSSLKSHFASSGTPQRTLIQKLGSADLDYIIKELESLRQKLHEKSSAIKDVDAALEIINMQKSSAGSVIGGTPEQAAYDFLAGDERLLILYTPEPRLAQEAAARFLDRMLFLKKVHGFRQKVLVVIDEAQEFATNDPRGPQIDSNRAVEALLRQGRKYGASALISTQRVAHLNTNALQQLHSYFVSTLPRYYDRMVIADSFSLDLGVLQKTTELQTGEWLFVSYKATRQKNVPVFIEAPNNEDALRKYLSAAGPGTEAS